jgi:Outer membrane protein beta-barrel domain
MRMHALTVMVCLLASSTVSAQDGVTGGVIGGPGWSTLTVKTDDSDFPDFSGRSGMAIGAFIVTPTRHGIGLEPEVLVTIKRAKATQAPVEALFRLTSLEVPILLRFTAPQQTAFHALFGPTFGFLLKARELRTESGITEDRDLSEVTESVEFGLTGGAGVDIGRLRIDGRFTWGLTDLNKENTFGNTSIKSRMFTVLAGVRLW